MSTEPDWMAAARAMANDLVREGALTPREAAKSMVLVAARRLEAASSAGDSDMRWEADDALLAAVRALNTAEEQGRG